MHTLRLSAECGRGARWRPDHARSTAAASAARRWSRRLLPVVLGDVPPPGGRYTVELVVTELVSNAVRHGGGVGCVGLACFGRQVLVTVCDRSRAAPVIVLQRDAERSGGRGLQLVATVADHWGFCWCCERGKCVWAQLSLVQTGRLRRQPSPGGRWEGPPSGFAGARSVLQPQRTPQTATCGCGY